MENIEKTTYIVRHGWNGYGDEYDDAETTDFAEAQRIAESNYCRLCRRDRDRVHYNIETEDGDVVTIIATLDEDGDWHDYR